MRSRSLRRLDLAWGRALVVELATLLCKYPELTNLSFQLCLLSCLQRTRRLAHQGLTGTPITVLQELPLALRIFLSDLNTNEVPHD